MDDATLGRLQRDVEDLITRVRTMENIDTPRQRELVQELRWLRDKVGSMDVEGTRITQVILKDQQRDIEEIKSALLRQDGEKRADRRVMLGALLAAASAIALAIFQAVSGR